MIASETSNISLIRWVTRTSEVPASRNWRISLSNVSTSPSRRPDVGSSRIRILGEVDMALAISTICFSARVRSRTMVCGEMPSPSRVSSS